jgi:hypothetical protein
MRVSRPLNELVFIYYYIVYRYLMQVENSYVYVGDTGIVVVLRYALETSYHVYYCIIVGTYIRMFLNSSDWSAAGFDRS